MYYGKTLLGPTHELRFNQTASTQQAHRECREGNQWSGTIHINDCRISVKRIRSGLVYEHKRLERIVDYWFVHVCVCDDRD